MIFLARTFNAEEALALGLANKVVALSDLKESTLEWVRRINGHSPQTLRMTKKSLNHESDELYSSWQQGMELLAHVWGSDEANEGMQAFLDKRPPNYSQFRERNKQVVDEYLTKRGVATS